MDYKVLYRKYRPDDFSNIVGQDYIVSILKNAIKTNKISHAYIFSGPRGTGKTSTAKVFAKAINCLNPTSDGPCNQCDNCMHFKENADIIEIDAASNNGVDEIREIINNIKLAPSYSKYKVYIIDEVHMLSTSAFNALLLTLEEPPKHVVFILATTNIEAVPITILSRCQRFDFHKISLQNLVNRLNYVVKEEKINIDPEAIEEIAYISEGGMRDALSILDQLSSSTDKITIKDVEEHFGSISKKQISDLYELILNNDVSKFTDMIQKFKLLAIDYKLLIKKILEHIEEQAIKSKEDANYKGLKYTDLKAITYDLANLSNFVNLNVDPYLLIEITLLNYFPGNNLEQKKEEIKRKEQKQSEKLESKENIFTLDTKDEEEFKINEEFIKIRINNCFVEAKKNDLQKIKDNWAPFIDSLDKTLLNLVVDTDIVAASETYAILVNKMDSTVQLINKKLEEIEQEYNQKFNANYKFIAINSDKWKDVKEQYIYNIKNKVAYEYIKEESRQEIIPEEKVTNELEKTALNIFDKEKIEIE